MIQFAKDKYSTISTLQDICIKHLQPDIHRVELNLTLLSQDNLLHLLSQVSPDDLIRIEDINQDVFSLIFIPRLLVDVWKMMNCGNYIAKDNFTRRVI